MKSCSSNLSKNQKAKDFEKQKAKLQDGRETGFLLSSSRIRSVHYAYTHAHTHIHIDICRYVHYTAMLLCKGIVKLKH